MITESNAIEAHVHLFGVEVVISYSVNGPLEKKYVSSISC